MEVRAFAIAVVRRQGRVAAEEAEDIANDVIEKLLQPGALDDVRNPKAFKGYVAIIAVRVVRDRFRSPWHRDRVVAGEGDDPTENPIGLVPDSHPSIERIAESRRTLEVVMAELAKLSPECQRVLAAYFQHILLDPQGSYATLTAALGLKRGTVSSRVKRCIDKLLQTPSVQAVLMPDDRSE